MQLLVRNLSKFYGTLKALDHFNMEFRPGIYGLLGCNGAGKTTLMNLLTDNIARNEGEILYEGKDILEWKGFYRSKVGYMPQQQGDFDHFSVQTFLLYIAYLKGISSAKAKKDISELLTQLDLEEWRLFRLKELSGGIRQRVLLAQALLGDPEFLILDEPTAGLDPRERIKFRNRVSALSNNKIILLATHIVSDIECIADRVILLKKGKCMASGTPNELMASLNGRVGEIPCEKDSIDRLQKQYPQGNILQNDRGMRFRIVSDSLPEYAEVVTTDIGLEDVYLYYLQDEIIL
jgi:ABC-2 type transport system ATP-binding protein